MKEITTEKLLKEYNLIIDEWHKTNEVHSISDFEEIVIELTKRETF